MNSTWFQYFILLDYFQFLSLFCILFMNIFSSSISCSFPNEFLHWWYMKQFMLRLSHRQLQLSCCWTRILWMSFWILWRWYSSSILFPLYCYSIVCASHQLCELLRWECMLFVFLLMSRKQVDRRNALLLVNWVPGDTTRRMCPESLWMATVFIDLWGDPIVRDFDSLQMMFSFALEDWMAVDPSEYPMLLCDSVFSTQDNRKRYGPFLCFILRVAQLVFEQFKSPAVLMYRDAPLSCFARAKGTGLVVDLGEDTTR